MKHLAVNEQETKRQGVLTWLDEQTLREVYLKAFEIAVKKSGEACKGMMTSFNRIGTRWTGGDYRLVTEVFMDEWGFRGAVICDFNTVQYMNVKQMVYAGGDLNLSTTRRWSAASSATSAADITVLRNATHNILYTVANSNAYSAEILYGTYAHMADRDDRDRMRHRRRAYRMGSIRRKACSQKIERTDIARFPLIPFSGIASGQGTAGSVNETCGGPCFYALS